MSLFLIRPLPDVGLPKQEGNWTRLSPHSPPPGDWLLSALHPIISFGYPYIIPSHLISPGMFNLHISYLPYNRGASPNLWAWVDSTPHGITLHRLEAGVDTGGIVSQCLLPLSPTSTLRTSYIALIFAGHRLIDRLLPSLKRGNVPTTPQSSGGSYHSLASSAALLSLLPLGYDTPVKDLPRYASHRRNMGRAETRHSS